MSDLAASGSSRLRAALCLAPSRHAALSGGGGDGGFVRELCRYEAKYWIRPALVSPIRAALAAFCFPDPHGAGDPPGYRLWTIQLDSPDLSMYEARRRDALTRFKLRLRRYAGDPTAPVVAEIKRKLHGTVYKSRCRLSLGALDRAQIIQPEAQPINDDPEEHETLAEFRRLLRQTGSRPQVALRYRREAWMSRCDDYARVTFDTELVYRPVRDVCDWRDAGVRWRRCGQAGERLPLGGVILELKSTERVPLWMQDLVRRFDLQRQAICKYAMAIESDRAPAPAGFHL